MRSLVFDSTSEVAKLSLAVATSVRFLASVCSMNEATNEARDAKRLGLNSPHVTFQLEPDNEATLAVLAFVRLVSPMSVNSNRQFH